MIIDLSKPENRLVNLTKATGGVANYFVGLKWKEGAFDCDVHALKCKLNANDDPILMGNGVREAMGYYNVNPNDLDERNQPRPFLATTCGGIEYSGDNTTGADSASNPGGYDEFVRIYGNKLDPACDEIPILLTLYDWKARGHNFGLVEKLRIAVHIMTDDGMPGEEIAFYRPSESFTNFVALQVGSFYRSEDNRDFCFKRVGQGLPNDLSEILKVYAPHLDFGYNH